MRVLHTVGSIDSRSGGPARSVPALVDALGSLGIEAALWTADGSTVDGQECLDRSLLAAAKKFRPDIIHDHGLWTLTNLRSAFVARMVGARFVLSPRGMAMPWALNHRATKKRVAWALYERYRFHSSDCLHSTSELETVQLRSLGFVGPIITAPNGVDIPDLKTSKGDDTRDERKVTFIGRIHPKKGLPLLVHAWSEVRPSNWQMHVFGPDELGHTKEVMDLVRQYGLEESWHFHQEVSDAAKWDVLADSDLFVLPSYSENFGIVVAEALASAVPVIATDTTPWSLVAQHGCGWSVSPEVAPLGAALADATGKSTQDLRAMGARGREWMKADFSWQDVGRTMRAEYAKLLGGSTEST